MLALSCLAATAHAEAPITHAEPNANLTILADESLLLPLAQISRAYAKHGKTPLTIILKNAAESEEQIEQGLEAHVMITENHPLVERLAAQGLTDVSSTRAIARTQLALVSTSATSKSTAIAKRISFAAMIFATPNLPVILPNADTTEGARANSLLKGYEFSEALTARAQVKPNHEEVIETLRDEPALGLILAADAVVQPDMVVLSLLSSDISPPVTYEAVVLASESMAEAKQFVNFLTSRPAQEIFAHFGFQPPGN